MASNSAWVIAVPADKEDAQQTRRRLDDATAGRGYASTFKFRIPKLKVGTIDTLIALSDDLAKLDTTMLALSKKIKRTFDDTRRAEPSKLRPEDRSLLAQHQLRSENGMAPADDMGAASVPQTLMIGDSLGADAHGANEAKTAREALCRFRWNRYVFNESDSIDALRKKIVDDFGKSDEELRRLLTDFNEVKGLVNAQERKESGSVLVRPISRFIRPEMIVETDHLTTLLLAVPKLKEQEFLDTYQTVEAAALARAAEEEARQAASDAKEKETRAAVDRALNTVTAPAAAGAARPSVSTTAGNADAADGAAGAAAGAAEGEAAKAAPAPAAPKPSTKIATPTVVPGSALRVVGEAEVPGDEFVLYRVVLFKRPDAASAAAAAAAAATAAASGLPAEVGTTANVERFKNICRDHRWTVRPFKYDPHEDDRNRLMLAGLVGKRRARWEHLLLWCESQFEEAYVAWLHVIAMRVYVESILRFGLSTEWIAALIIPNKGAEKKVRDILGSLYAGLSSSSMLGSGSGDAELDAAALGGAGEYYPYVYVSADLTDL